MSLEFECFGDGRLTFCATWYLQAMNIREIHLRFSESDRRLGVMWTFLHVTKINTTKIWRNKHCYVSAFVVHQLPFTCAKNTFRCPQKFHTKYFHSETINDKFPGSGCHMLCHTNPISYILKHLIAVKLQSRVPHCHQDWLLDSVSHLFLKTTFIAASISARMKYKCQKCLRKRNEMRNKWTNVHIYVWYTYAHRAHARINSLSIVLPTIRTMAIQQRHNSLE